MWETASSFLPSLLLLYCLHCLWPFTFGGWARQLYRFLLQGVHGALRYGTHQVEGAFILVKTAGNGKGFGFQPNNFALWSLATCTMYNSANLIISILFNFNNQMQMMPLLIIDPDLYNMYIGIRGGFFFPPLILFWKVLKSGMRFYLHMEEESSRCIRKGCTNVQQQWEDIGYYSSLPFCLFLQAITPSCRQWKWPPLIRPSY